MESFKCKRSNGRGDNRRSGVMGEGSGVIWERGHVSIRFERVSDGRGVIVSEKRE